MSSAKLVAALTAAAVGVSACGATVKSAQGGRGRVDDPRTTKNNRVTCLRQAHLPVQEVGHTGLQIGPLPQGPTVVFAPTPGSAQAQQIQGQEQGAEAIGSALLYPNRAPDGELKKIEDCLAKGVSG
jgi:hypothetical protein